MLNIKKICKMSLLLAAFLISLALVSRFKATCQDESHESYAASELFKQLGSADHDLFTFIQITDLHISMFRAASRYEQLKDFCRINLQAIKPQLVLVSGDMTDAIAKDLIVAKQFEREWEMYHNFYNNCMAESGIVNWLDLRGNHDNFNVDGLGSPMNYYPKYGAQRKRHPGSYMTVIHGPNNKSYAFVAVDATLDPGPKRILNFFGDLDDKKIEKLNKFQKEIEATNVSASFWFGHYPSSSILTPDGLRALAAKGIAYFCGHLHTWSGLVPKMYWSHSPGMLELELADWKEERMYRIAVMDQGLFTFADVKHGVWPAVVVLNPKPLITVQRSKEPFHLAASSSHIRLLVYSPSEIELCQVRIDNGPWTLCQLTGKSNPLFTAPWSPASYAKGLHTLEVKARDKSGAESQTSIDFALDASGACFPSLAKLALSTNLTNIGFYLFLGCILALVSTLLFLRLEHCLILKRKVSECKGRGIFSRGFRILANIDVLFYGLLFYTVYLALGPWFYGDLIDGKQGLVFIWGTYISETFQLGALTYYYGVFHLLFFNFPLFVILAHVGAIRFKEEIVAKTTPREATWWERNKKSAPFISFLVLQSIGTFFFGVSYGWIAFIVNPFRTWSLFLSCYLWHRAVNLKETDFAEIRKTFA